MGFDIEIDVRSESNKLWVGHDRPEFQLSKSVTSNEMISRIWYHAKDLTAVELLPEHALVFAHAEDDFTIVSGDRKIIWLHPRLNPQLDKLIASSAITPGRTIVLDVEGHPRLDPQELIKKGNHFLGVCTDWPIDWLETFVASMRTNFGVKT